jgi:8-oxo-dGTP pyrophosphatase MutT (NUDIX family)
MGLGMTENDTAPPIRDAATVVVLRRHQGGASVLMGQRGAQAIFMPDKFVFPGGAVDPDDSVLPLAGLPDAGCMARLSQGHVAPHALLAAAIREVWEETGLCIGRPAQWTNPPNDWLDFAGRGLCPDATHLRFIFRAITPPGRPRRFDARFFLLDADALAGDPDDFSAASDELSHLQWVNLAEVRKLDLPFITEVVLAEVAAMVRGEDLPESVPFFDNSGPVSCFTRIESRT